MDSQLKWIEAIAPDLLEELKRRYLVLRHIQWNEPVGRRLLAQKLALSEGALRTELDFLKGQNLVESSKPGMILSERGLEIYEGLEQVMNQIFGVQKLENQLATHLNITRCVIVSGDSDEQSRVLDDMGKVVNSVLDLLLPEGQNIIAAMGGTTMAHVANRLSTKLSDNRQLVFVPARGGIGEGVAIQANTVCAQMAAQTGGEHRVLYIPEQVSDETYRSLIKEPAIQDVLSLIQKSRAVVHSIGGALPMATRRNMPESTMQMLISKKAVGEAFGYFFDEAGREVYKIPRIGLQMNDLQKVPVIVAVAGGKSKAKAIEAYFKNAPQQSWLITDEGAAKMILKEETLFK